MNNKLDRIDLQYLISLTKEYRDDIGLFEIEWLKCKNVGIKDNPRLNNLLYMISICILYPDSHKTLKLDKGLIFFEAWKQMLIDQSILAREIEVVKHIGNIAIISFNNGSTLTIREIQ